jgi:hypothetical protein
MEEIDLKVTVLLLFIIFISFNQCSQTEKINDIRMEISNLKYK